MSKQHMLALFLLAGIEVQAHWQLQNEYWGHVYPEENIKSPWWLVKTAKGMIKIGWRKRVINIDWSDTPIRQVITPDEVTKEETMVHAWSYLKALEYLTALAKEFNAPSNTEIKSDV